MCVRDYRNSFSSCTGFHNTGMQRILGFFRSSQGTHIHQDWLGLRRSRFEFLFGHGNSLGMGRRELVKSLLKYLTYLGSPTNFAMSSHLTANNTIILPNGIAPNFLIFIPNSKQDRHICSQWQCMFHKLDIWVRNRIYGSPPLSISFWQSYCGMTQKERAPAMIFL